MRTSLIALFIATFGAAGVHAQEGAGAAGPSGTRKVMPASDEAEAAIRGFSIPPGFKVNLFAAEPHVANISSFDIAADGRAYVVEVFRRRGGGVLDMRNLPAWLDDDLASRTVADRVALVRRRLSPQEQRAMAVESDRVRVVEDRDGDGRADHAMVFAEGFNKLEEGTAAGVLAFDGNVYFANIPNLWLLRDQNNDGRADARKVLHTGFGVHYEISGHDLHGLRLGPDGRIYFSIGDRGMHVAGGRGFISNPDSGAVLRCEPDGSGLELLHTGLRNPQDLAFDEYGNLFTGDNNSDGGDASRWVYVVEGGDSGWRTAYQWHEFPVSRGPWNNERLWDVKSDVPAAYIVPPLANPAIAGPSGLTYTGGAGLPPEWANRFLLVDFRGGPTNSGVWALQNKPKGASFELAETKKLVWGTLATDVECGYDGGVYFSDWVTGWAPLGKGRIYRLRHAESGTVPSVTEAAAVLREGMRGRGSDKLRRLMEHGDGRVRTAAQFELARRGDVTVLASVAAQSGPLLPRVHAVWGLGQLARRHSDSSRDALVGLLTEGEAEVRAQAAKALSEAAVRHPTIAAALLPLLEDPSDRVKYFAAVALGKAGDRSAVKPLAELLGRNDDRDPYLRHAAVMGLAAVGDVEALWDPSRDPSAAVRLGALLALRRLGSPQVARFLDDAEPRLVLEAARAINDAPIDGATVALAEFLARPGAVGRGKVRDLILMRALNAAYRVGTPESAATVVKVAGGSAYPDFLRAEALKMIRDWAEPGRRDRVTGIHHPLAARDPKVAYDAVRPLLPALLRDAPDGVRVAAAALVGPVGLEDANVLLDLVKGTKFSAEARAAGIRALAGQKAPQLTAAVDAALADRDPAVRRAAILVIPALKDGLGRLRKIIESGPVPDQQAAFAAITASPDAAVQSLLLEGLDRLTAGKVWPEVRLDVVAAAESKAAVAPVAAKLQLYQATSKRQGPLGEWRDVLAGGDATRGRRIFQERADVQCLRCHSVKGEGGAAGPDLAGIGRKQSREYLLESILFPAKHIAQGWETVTVRVRNGDTFAGVLKAEDEKQLVLVDPEKGEVRIDKANVTGRRGGQTAMPSDIAQPLTKMELRDLVEFLAGLK